MSIESGGKRIILTNGMIAVVDSDDYVRVSGFSWVPVSGRRGAKTTYAVTRSRIGRGVRVSTLMHRIIMNAPLGILVDHRDGDGLNNRKSNLRLATNQQNLANRGKNRNNSSGYKGVRRARSGGKWVARIKVGGIEHHLGSYVSAAMAVSAYNAAAKKYFGEFAGKE